MKRLLHGAVLVLAFGCASYRVQPHRSARIEIISQTLTSEGSIVEFELVNDSARVFKYEGYEVRNVVPLTEQRSWSGWKTLGFVCGTGMTIFELPPHSRRRFSRVVRERGTFRLGLQDQVTGTIAWSKPLRAAV